MEEKLVNFLKNEFNLTIDELLEFSPKQREELFDKCVEIELDELEYGYDDVTERCELACLLQRILV